MKGLSWPLAMRWVCVFCLRSLFYLLFYFLLCLFPSLFYSSLPFSPFLLPLNMLTHTVFLPQPPFARKTRGLNADFMKKGEAVHVPMKTAFDSFGVAAAGAILMDRLVNR
eukprot:m.103855 g.103855  ORF g.103855 m.103855 type:complete len:110 (+) comp22424_c0_seq2:716-1045(+)